MEAISDESGEMRGAAGRLLAFGTKPRVGLRSFEHRGGDGEGLRSRQRGRLRNGRGTGALGIRTGRIHPAMVMRRTVMPRMLMTCVLP